MACSSSDISTEIEYTIQQKLQEHILAGIAQQGLLSKDQRRNAFFVASGDEGGSGHSLICLNEIQLKKQKMSKDGN